MKKYISYGKPEFDFKKFRNVYDHMQTKPGYGFWACSYNPNGEYYSDWEQWFIDEYDQYPGEFGALTFQIKDNAKIFVIKDKKDFIALMKKYPSPDIGIKQKLDIKTHELIGIPYLKGIGIDFKKMAEEYDGIELLSDVCTKRNWQEPFFVSAKQLKLQFPKDQEEYYRKQYSCLKIESPAKYMDGDKKIHVSIEDWAVPSICIFNPDIITEVETFEIDHHQNVLNMLQQGYSKREIEETLAMQIKRPEFVSQIMYYCDLEHRGDEVFKRNRYLDAIRSSNFSKETSNLPAKQNKFIKFVRNLISKFFHKKEQQKQSSFAEHPEKKQKSWDLPKDTKETIQRNQVETAQQIDKINNKEHFDDPDRNSCY